MYCNFCGQELPDHARFCMKCGQSIGRTEAVEQDSIVDSDNSQVGKTCPFCQFPIKPTEKYVVCPGCKVIHHQACWKENGNKCTTFGCRVTSPDVGAIGDTAYRQSEAGSQLQQDQPAAESDPLVPWAVAAMVLAWLYSITVH